MSREGNKSNSKICPFLCIISLYYSSPFLYSNIFQLLAFVSISASSFTFNTFFLLQAFILGTVN